MEPARASGVYGSRADGQHKSAWRHSVWPKSMIEQTSMDDRRKAPGGIDEARLRQQAIGVKLRQMFDEVVNEPVPDEFLDILRRADSKPPTGEDR
jgi:hypothetical protein